MTATDGGTEQPDVRNTENSEKVGSSTGETSKDQGGFKAAVNSAWFIQPMGAYLVLDTGTVVANFFVT